ncbi:PREDICTED: DNA methyltransferase 1-associated protein 1-like isoform X2 [Priapulus caudatus]|uniref:DNA methyltransferase 1-associated protein 1-like isoform X2 n=1 Tax=Priapulus caudatus TaxID=37621 RepID=A0ABM1ECR9_PRICU|nr:PREDICTED: DNA methyltransferase 1-associated protein 1-like isoform X2 [Priapulus caudatus]
MTSADVREILEIELPEQQPVTKESLFSDDKKQKVFKKEKTFKKPQGMHREVWGLLFTDPRDAPPLLPSDTSTGYKQAKAKIGRSRVRPWKWMPFHNPARKDGAVFYHWRRMVDEGKDYAFSRFNKQVPVPTYSDLEYQQHLHDENWTREETDHLFGLCRRFDLRFIIIKDRYDRERYPDRTVEDLKERYYHISNVLAKMRALPGPEAKLFMFDADHDRRRKLQLEKLYNRTQEDVEEEETLMQELRKIEQRKREREKKAQDLQKLISAADNSDRRLQKKQPKKHMVAHKLSKGGATVTSGEASTTPDTTGIKFPEFKTSGVTLRSHRMKLPTSLGQKKSKAIEQLLEELGIEQSPMPTEEVATHFNDVRCDMVLLYELKLAHANCEFEVQTLKHRLEALVPGRLASLNLPASAAATTTPSTSGEAGGDSPGKTRKISEIIDVVGNAEHPSRKRRAALEQRDIMKKLKGNKS